MIDFVHAYDLLKGAGVDRQLHQHGIVHNSLSPRSIWLGQGSKVQLQMGVVPDLEFESPTDPKNNETRYDYVAPELHEPDGKATIQSDLYSLGCTLFRLISGRTVFDGDSPKDKINHHKKTPAPGLPEKYKAPEALQKLLKRLLSKDIAKRPESANDVAQALAEIGAVKLKDERTWPANSAMFRNSLKAWHPPESFAQKVTGNVDVETVEPEKPTTTPAERIEAAKRRKPSRWRMPLAVGSSMFALAGIIGILAYMANQTEIKPKPEEVIAQKPPEAPPENVVPEIPAVDLKKVGLVQDLIDDDDRSLWESPTTGLPIEFSYVPSTPRLIFAFRPAEIWKQEEGERLLNSLGPDLANSITGWKDSIGAEFEDLEQVIVSFHSIDGGPYQPFFIVRLNGKSTPENLTKTWKDPATIQIDEDHTMFDAGENAFYIIPEKEDDTTTRFVFGKPDLVREVVTEGGVNIFSGTLSKLAALTDRSRHINFLFLRPALFNEQGQSWMSGQLALFNRQLDLFLQDEIRGGLISLHLDEGTYLEMAFDKTVDLKSRELKDSLIQSIRDQRDMLTRFVMSVPASPYWDNVRQRYDNMLNNVYQNLRWGVEYDTVIGNAWLPPVAAHNLLASSELLTAFSKGAGAAVATTNRPKVPQTIEEMLAAPRSLTVTTNPDLNLLLQSIRTEIMDDYGELPFDFNIQLLGNHLSKDGITQNQRPGDFEMTNQSLSQILTEIMVRCNPNRDISGPKDPNCKLVWAIGPDPDDNSKKAILVTTRDGVVADGLELPDAFREN